MRIVCLFRMTMCFCLLRFLKMLKGLTVLDDLYPQTDLILYWILLSSLKWARTWPVWSWEFRLSLEELCHTLFCNTSNTKKIEERRCGKTVPISAWNKKNITECRKEGPHLEVVHVQPANHTGGINACSIKPSGSRRLSLICHLKEAPDYNCLLSWNSSCHAEVADGGWQ